MEILERVLAGGLSKMTEAGCTVIGGHSVRDDEMKFGYSVTGLIDPSQVLSNACARPGDRLLFTKALGTGVISTAVKKGVAQPAWMDGAVRSMTTLNKAAAEVIVQHRKRVRPESPERATDGGVHSMTDVTGFGLIAHAREMALASQVSLRIFAGKVPLLEGALECVRAGHIPGGLNANREFAECVVSYDEGVPEEIRTTLFDPQTAGGLLISIARDEAAEVRDALQKVGVHGVEIGEVLPQGRPLIAVTM
jgi:selenide,water dikinase